MTESPTGNSQSEDPSAGKHHGNLKIHATLLSRTDNREVINCYVHLAGFHPGISAPKRVISIVMAVEDLGAASRRVILDPPLYENSKHRGYQFLASGLLLHEIRQVSSEIWQISWNAFLVLSLPSRCLAEA